MEVKPFYVNDHVKYESISGVITQVDQKYVYFQSSKGNYLRKRSKTDPRLELLHRPYAVGKVVEFVSSGRLAVIEKVHFGFLASGCSFFYDIRLLSNDGVTTTSETVQRVKRDDLRGCDPILSQPIVEQTDDVGTHRYLSTSQSTRSTMAATMQWESLPEMKTQRRRHGMAAMDGKLYATGGHDDDGNNRLKTGEVLEVEMSTGAPSLRIPRDATLQQIADAHNERVAKVEQNKANMIQKETAKCDATRREIEVLEAKLASQIQHLTEQTAEFDQVLETVRAEAAEAATKAESFAARVVSIGLDELNIDDVYELLHRLQVKVSKSVLQNEDLSGVAMAVLTETDMEQVLNISKLGDRRKLSMTLQRLSNQQGFAPSIDTSAPGALGWDTSKVCDWLSSEGFEQCTDNFREHRIDGPVLLKLTSDDFKLLGLNTIGAKAKFMKKLDVVKKQTYAGQVIGESSSSSSAAAPAPHLTEDQRRLVLEQVLEENAALQEQLSQSHPRRDEMPDHFMCPITNEVMEDPVVAMDGFTYERSAISTWFQRHNTSPMTRAVIPPTLLPNVGKRSEIANWE